MDKEQSCSRDSFVLKSLKRLKLQHLWHGAQPVRSGDYFAKWIYLVWCYVAQQHSRRHITPCLNEQSEAELSEFINTVQGPPAPVWLHLTLQEPTPVSSEPVQISHPSECTTVRETTFVREAWQTLCTRKTGNTELKTHRVWLKVCMTNLICVLWSYDLI